jgi:hypothetical protein
MNVPTSLLNARLIWRLNECPSPWRRMFPSLSVVETTLVQPHFLWPLAWTTSNGSYSAVASTKDLIAVVSRTSEHHSRRLVAPVLTSQVARASFPLCWSSSSLMATLLATWSFAFRVTFFHIWFQSLTALVGIPAVLWNA